MTTKWLALQVATLAVLASVAGASVLAQTPRPIDYGSCQTASADPVNICFDPTYAAHVKAQQDAKAALLSAAYHCAPPATYKGIPAAAIMRDPAGNITHLPFDAAWSAAHHGSWTLASCAV